MKGKQLCMPFFILHHENVRSIICHRCFCGCADSSTSGTKFFRTDRKSNLSGPVAVITDGERGYAISAYRSGQCSRLSSDNGKSIHQSDN